MTFLLVIIAQLILVSGQLHWWGGYSYSNRFMLSTAIFFMIGFAYFLNVIKKKWLIVLVCFLLIGWNFNLIFQYGSGIICPDCSASPMLIIQNTFTKVIPNLLETIKTFIFARGSFL